MGVTAFSLSESKTFGDKPFPFALILEKPASSEEWRSWLVQNREKIISKDLPQYGAILFRGFLGSEECPATALDFAKFIETLNVANFPYVGGNAVRTKVVGDRVFTANESPPERIIPFHHELAQAPEFPGKLLFFCEVPAESGGQTPILLSDIVYEQLRQAQPEFMDKVEQHGVIYSRVMTEEDRAESAIGRGWKSTFNVSTKEEAERRLQKDGCTWEWLENNRLRQVSAPLSAVRVHPQTGKKVFFNQIYAAYFGWQDEFNTAESCVTYGNGDRLPREALLDMARIMEGNCVAFPWQRGDVLLVDNYGAYHARRQYAGKRRVLASLAK